MPFYEVVWPPWTLEEDIMLVYFCSRAFELLDVTHIMAHRLHRAVRNRRQCITHMERLNRDQEHKGLPRLCSNGMAFWDRAAVDAFLIDSTPDTYLLEDLLTFHWRYEQLLGAVCPATAISLPFLLAKGNNTVARQWRSYD